MLKLAGLGVAVVVKDQQQEEQQTDCSFGWYYCFLGQREDGRVGNGGGEG